ncbi:hypothetical protein [Mesorhizobium sp. WSM4887]|uniref:hypothetical protein n=1 Tax=Mesorhizobium sp. WSM4887 TaxID=3038543 RepID=UPI002417AD5E|nr:hypothetical protein [Mesorhizobium sp. WSM4887]MDG4890468.1 hypothetical protein [Mesorhizobium sp. WSM4887]
MQVALHLRDTGDYQELVPDDKAEKVQKWLRLWRLSSVEFELDHVTNSIDRLSKRLNNGAMYRDLEYGFNAIKDALDDGLEGHFIYRYPAHRARILSEWKNDWRAVYTRFPESVNDIRVGVDLWALQHHTASVFHMMRVLEIGLRALAHDLQLSFTIENWQNIVDRIEAAIKQQQKSLPRGEERNSRLQFLGEAAKEFSYFKDGWRNYVSHNKTDYDEHQSRSVMEHVSHFMAILAKGLTVSQAEATGQGLDQTSSDPLQHQAPERSQ